MPPPDYSTAFQLKLDQISSFRRELQVSTIVLYCTVLCIARCTVPYCTVLFCIVLQVEYHAEYERALTEVKDELMAKEGPDLVETMKDEIREWFNKEK